MNTEGERIKHIRKDVLHLTLDKFGERFGVKKSILSSIENGNAVVTDQMRKSICIAYGISEEWLRTGEGDIYAAQDRKEKLTAWVNNVLSDSPDSFRSRFITLLSELPEEWWTALERKALEIFREEDPDGAQAIEDEVEEYRRQLEKEKSQEASSSPSHASGE